MNYFLEGVDYAWDLIRETATSQKFYVVIGGPMSLKATIDIHYTRPAIAYVTMCLIGLEDYFTDGVSHQLFSDLEKIIQRHGEYRIIDYSLVFTDSLFNGNYAISK